MPALAAEPVLFRLNRIVEGRACGGGLSEYWSEILGEECDVLPERLTSATLGDGWLG